MAVRSEKDPGDQTTQGKYLTQMFFSSRSPDRETSVLYLTDITWRRKARHAD